MMENWQLGAMATAIVGGLGAIAKVIQWAAKRFFLILDNNTKTLSESLDRNTSAHLESVKEMSRMSAKLDYIYQATGRVDEFIKEETSKNYDTGQVDSELEGQETPVEIPSKKKIKTTYFKKREQ